MNVQVQPGISGAALPCSLFKAGDFVRMKGGRLGQVMRDSPDNSLTILLLENRPEVELGSGQGYADYEPCELTMWTPDIALPVAAPAPLPPLDLEKVNERLMKAVAATNLLEDLATAEMNSNENAGKPGHLFSYHVQLIVSVLEDTTGDLLDMIENEERRLRQAV